MTRIFLRRWTIASDLEVFADAAIPTVRGLLPGSCTLGCRLRILCQLLLFRLQRVLGSNVEAVVRHPDVSVVVRSSHDSSLGQTRASFVQPQRRHFSLLHNILSQLNPFHVRTHTLYDQSISLFFSVCLQLQCSSFLLIFTTKFVFLIVLMRVTCPAHCLIVCIFPVSCLYHCQY